MASDRSPRGVCGSARGLTACSLIQSVLLVLFVLYSSSAAQQPSIRPYESEEDLWEALNDGEITFDEFTELLDLARAGADSLLAPRSDWEALPGSDAGYLAPPDASQTLIQAAPVRSSRVDIPWVSSVRMGVDADLHEPSGADGYSVIRLHRGALRGVFDFEHDRDDGGEWRRRSLVWQSRNCSVVLGNFEPRWGRGLVVGRRSRVLSSSEVSGSFWQPTRGRFNGGWVSTTRRRMFSTQVMFSEVASSELLERVVAARFEASVGKHSFGISGLSGGFRRDSDELSNIWQSLTNVFGGDVLLQSGSAQVLAELASQQGGVTAKAVELSLPLRSGQFNARAWSYGSRFSNPWSGGPGNGDTKTVSLGLIDESFSSRIAGERGFDFSTRIKVSPTANLRWDWMSHREEPGANLEHSGVFRAEFKRPTYRTTPFLRARVNEEETESFSLGNYLWWGPAEREVNLRIEFGTHYADEVQFIRAGIGAKLQLNRVVRIAPTVRWVDPNLDMPSDGYWYLYLTETVLPIEGARVEMAMVWKKHEDKSKDDLVELRVRGFVR